ncbi:MAG: TraB/GumN family protein [Eubacterium sp.]|nr:TraB/GumN family protein [Eubacterium sp.]
MESENITRITLGEKEIILVGTAHVSPASVAEVKALIEGEKPDTVCIELDKGRYESINKKDQWKDMDIVKVIKEGKAGFLFANIILSNYQRKLAEQFGIRSGQEMLQGIASAKECGAEIVLADRDIQVTFNRIWRGCSFFEKMKLLMTIIFSIVDDEEISEEELESLKSEDMLSAALAEMGNAYKGIKTHLVDERDQYLANKIKNAPGKKVVAVLGAAHVPGIKKELFKEQDMAALEAVPPKSKAGKIIGWSIPVLLVLLVALTFTVNPGSGWEQTRFWLLLTMCGSGLGALLAFGHPLSILTAVVVAPISALSPVLAAGWFSGLCEAHFKKPKVEDFEALPKDLLSLKGLWHNKVTKLLLMVILTNVGCAAGNIVGSLNIIGVFFKTFL